MRIAEQVVEYLKNGLALNAVNMPAMSPEQFRAALEKRVLKAVSAHFSYQKFKDDPESIAKEAKALTPICRDLRKQQVNPPHSPCGAGA